jgi:hypothetical protein
MESVRFAQKLQTPKAFADSSPGLGFQPWVSLHVAHPTLKAFANSVGVDFVTVCLYPRLKHPELEFANASAF